MMSNDSSSNQHNSIQEFFHVNPIKKSGKGGVVIQNPNSNKVWFRPQLGI